MKRSRKRVTAITTGSLATVLAMGTLTGFALTSQKEAETQKNIAQAKTASAEELIEFMVTDLKDKLDEVGRLDVLQAVGQKASDYYDQYELSEHSDDALGRRARVFHILGEIQDDYGNLDEADKYFKRAYSATKMLLGRDPQNPHRMFEHAQSSYYAGYVPYRKQEYNLVKKYFDEYSYFAEQLILNDPENKKWQIEGAYAQTNLGALFAGLGEFEYAIIAYEDAKTRFEEIMLESPERSNKLAIDYADTIGWISKYYASTGQLELAKSYRVEEIEQVRNIYNTNKLKNWEALNVLAAGERNLARLEFLSGDYLKAMEIAELSVDSFFILTRHEPENVPWLEGLAYAQVLLRESKSRLGHKDVNNIQKDLEMTLLKFPTHQKKNAKCLLIKLELSTKHKGSSNDISCKI